MASLGDVFMRMLFEDQQLTAEGKRAGAKAGDAAGKSMSQRIKSSLGPAIATGIGTVLGAGFAIAAKGAAELDAATRQFQADTGATAEEATAASHAIAGMYRDNLQGFDQISAALSKVHTDLGLTGQEAEKVTASFLKFGTATGRDAADAVAGFDDILDAWGLTAAETPRIMDLLIASHQKYGGSIAENEKALNTLAPAMQALGMNVDDSVGLLNLFAVSGVDASKATAALNKAVKGLKPGETLDDLIKQISSIEDPTLRAQKAIEIFGARGGVSLANALRPGVNSLRDFVPAADEVAGATERASDAIESSFGNQFKLILKNAGGALAEFGNNFGPLLLVAGQFGPKMITAIGGGLGAIAGKLFPGLIARLIPAAAVAGTTTGAAMGTSAAIAEVATQTTGVVAGQAAVGTAAIPAAAASGTRIGAAMGAAAALVIPALIAAAFAIPVALVFDKVKKDIAAQGAALTDQADEFFKVASLEEIENARRGVAGDLARAQKDVIGDALGLTGSAEIQAVLDKLDAEIARRRAHANVTQGTETFGPAAPNKQLDAIATTLTATQKQLHADLETAIDTIKTSNDPAAVGAAIAAVLKSVLGGAGNADQTKAIVAELTTKRDAALARGDTATAKLFTDAIARLEPFAKGRQWQAEQIAEARKVVASNATTAEKVAALKGIQQDLLSHQRTMAAGIVGKLLDVEKAVNKVRIPSPTIISQIIGGGGPTPKTPPKSPPKIPAKPATFGGKSPDERASGGPVTAGNPYWVGEKGPELFQPKTSGTIIPNKALRRRRQDTDLTDEEQRQAEKEMRAKAERYWRQKMHALFARLSNPSNRIPPSRRAALDRFLGAGGVGQFEKGGDFYNPALGEFQDARFVASAKLDPSQIQDRRAKNRSGSPDERAAGGPVTAGRPYWVGERGIPELFVPRASGTVVPVADVKQGSDSGAFNPTINVQGLIPYRDPFTIATELKRLRDFVVVTPRRQPT